MLTLNVGLEDARSYPIHIGYGLRHQYALFQPYLQDQNVVIVTNTVVQPLYLQALQEVLESHNPLIIILPDGERFKTMASVEMVFDQMLEVRLSRKTTLIALGGGVIGDMVGFAAACYQRGVNFIQVPTTLLAQVDSSVGGKTGVNHRLGKNMIGAFYQPKLVIIDVETLSTLPDREFSSGLAEVIKHGLIGDAAFYSWLCDNMDKLLARDTSALSYAIKQSCLNKIRIVEADEKESGCRALLNLGHTFGHAIETFTEYKSYLHGEAVAVGMLMAAEVSAQTMGFSIADVTRLKSLLIQAGLLNRPVPHIEPMTFLKLMLRDKKAHNGQLNLVLLREVGSAELVTHLSGEYLINYFIQRNYSAV